MTEDKAKQYAPSDDIDLISLLERIYLFFRRFRNIFFIAVIAGIVLGVIAYFSSQKIYQSKLILHSSYLTNQEEIEIIGYWNELLKRNEDKILAPIFNCSEDLLHKVISLEGIEIQKNYSSTDPNGYYIEAKIRDNSILGDLQNAIIYGLNNTEFVKQKLSAKEDELKDLIDKTTTEIARIDSVKTKIEVIITSGEKNSYPLLGYVQGINKEGIDLNEKLLGYKNELKTISSIQVLQSFIPLNTPVSVSLKVTIAMGVILCLAVAYLFTLLKYVEDRLKKRVNNNA